MNHEHADAGLQSNLHALTHKALSPRARFGHVLLLLAATAMAIVLFALLATEPDLPMRTTAAFAAMLGIAAAWMIYSGWVLMNRNTLLINHRVIAGTMAVTFSALFTAGALAVGFAGGADAAFLAAGLGTGFTAVSTWLLARARADRARLLARRDALLREVRR